MNGDISKFDEHAPGWRHASSDWMEKLQELVDFVAENDRMPHTTDDGAVGRRLKSWRQTGNLSPERLKQLDVQVPGWRTARSISRSPNMPWEQRARELQAFSVRESRLPRLKEGTLGTWLNNQRRNAELLPERLQWLNENVPGWKGPGTRTKITPAWLERAHELLAFVEENERIPGHPDGAIGNWRRAQMSSKFPERKQWLDERLPGWDTFQNTQPRQK